MDDAVVAQVGVDRHDGQVVLEAGVGSDWKMAKVFKFWALVNEMLTSILSWQEQNARLCSLLPRAKMTVSLL